MIREADLPACADSSSGLLRYCIRYRAPRQMRQSCEWEPIRLIPEPAMHRLMFLHRVSNGKAVGMIREMLGIAEGILQDLHNDHSEIASLIERIEESNDSSQRGMLFDEMKTKLLSHAQAEQEVLYRRLETSQSEASRSFAHEGTNEHELVEQQLRKISADRARMSEPWTAELRVLHELVDHHVAEEESTGFSCARSDFDKNELEEMARQFQTRKAQLATRVA